MHVIESSLAVSGSDTRAARLPRRGGWCSRGAVEFFSAHYLHRIKSTQRTASVSSYGVRYVLSHRRRLGICPTYVSKSHLKPSRAKYATSHLAGFSCTSSHEAPECVADGCAAANATSYFFRTGRAGAKSAAASPLDTARDRIRT